MLVAKKIAPQWQQQNYLRSKVYSNRKTQNNVVQVAWKLKMIAAILVCTLTAIAVISHNVYVVEVTGKIGLATAQLQTLQEDSKHIKLQAASMRTPARLEEKAYELGMQYPGREQMIVLTAEASD